MQALQRFHAQFAHVLHAGTGRLGTRQRGVVGDSLLQRAAADGVGILQAARFSSTTLTIKLISPFLIMSTICGRPSVTLFTGVHVKAGSLQGRRTAARSDQVEAKPGQRLGDLDHLRSCPRGAR